jgi:SAM-dependent methyltransferase
MRKLLKRVRRTAPLAREIIGGRVDGGAASGTCGFAEKLLRRDVLWLKLVAQLKLTPDWQRWINHRESSHCAWCASSLRNGQLASTIVQAANQRYGTSASRLAALFRHPHPRACAIAEVNSSGNPHHYRARCPIVRFSEFRSTAPGVPCQELMNLSYADASFDLVINADTLNHVSDIEEALREIRRVLKPGGMHVFSIPAIWNRATRQRATLRDGVLTHHSPPSHHGAPLEGKTDFLVFNECGGDFVECCVASEFEAELLRNSANPALVTFIAQRSTTVAAHGSPTPTFRLVRSAPHLL